MFAYYVKWIHNFSDKILPLATMADLYVPTMCTNVVRELHSSAASVMINKIQLGALLDSCCNDSYINDRVA